MVDEPKAAHFEKSEDPQPIAAVIEDDLETDLTDEERETLPDNAADRQSIKAKMRRQKMSADERAMVIKSLLQVEAGQRFLMWLICQQSGVFGASINGQLDTNFTHHREGQRAVGLVLQQECIAAAPRQYAVALENYFTQGNKR